MVFEIVRNAALAVANGFAGFNGNNRHVCLDLPQENVTISVRSPDGGLMTIAFAQRHEGKGHQSADIVYHSGYKVHGKPVQKALFLGAGPTIAAVDPMKDEVPTTTVVVQMYQTTAQVNQS